MDLSRRILTKRSAGIGFEQRHRIPQQFKDHVGQGNVLHDIPREAQDRGISCIAHAKLTNSLRPAHRRVKSEPQQILLKCREIAQLSRKGVLLHKTPEIPI